MDNQNDNSNHSQNQQLNDLGASLDLGFAVEAWKRLPDEPARQFAWFHCYLLLGPGRSLLAAYRQFQSKKVGGKAAISGDLKVSAAWQSAAFQFDWKGRAQAYDAAQARLREQEFEQRLRDYQEQSWGFVQKLQERADAMLRHPLMEKKLSKTTTSPDGKTTINEYTLKPASWRAGDIPRLLQVADTLARSAMGIEIDALVREVNDMDEEELLAQAEAGIKARRGTWGLNGE